MFYWIFEFLFKSKRSVFKCARHAKYLLHVNVKWNPTKKLCHVILYYKTVFFTEILLRKLGIKTSYMLIAARQNLTRPSFCCTSKVLFCGLFNKSKYMCKYDSVFDLLQKGGLMQLLWKSGVLCWHHWSWSSAALCLGCSLSESSKGFWKVRALWIDDLQLCWSRQQWELISSVSRTSYRHMQSDALCWALSFPSQWSREDALLCMSLNVYMF